MCGIAGFYSDKVLNHSEFVNIGEKMLDTMKHRGPDDNGFWVNQSKNLLF